MKANELRIGNLVEACGVICKLHSLTEDAFYCRPLKKSDVKKISSVAIYDFKPIQLTEEWLIKFGFKKEVLSDGSAYYYTLDLNDDKYCDLSISNGDKNGCIEITLFPYEEWFRYKHVHQLQNLYFALTGKELTIKV